MSNIKTGGIQSFLIQAISWILGSSVILFGITTFYNEYINIPDVAISVNTTDKNFQLANITVTNKGMKPATNLVLTINAPGNIEDSPQIFNTQNLTVESSINNSIFQLSTSRLVPWRRIHH